MWLPVSSPGGGAFELHSDSADAIHGERFQRIKHVGSVPGHVGVANYGLNCQHGMVFVAGRAYEGYTHVRAHGERPVNVTIALHDWKRNVTLASASAQLAPARGWVRVPLALTPSDNTTCGAMTADTPFGMRDDVATCSGRLVISTDTAGGAFDVDLTALSPGEWGTEPAPWAGSLGAQRRVVQCPSMARD